MDNAARVRTNTCPSTQETTPVDKACHDTMRGEFGSSMRSVANLKGFKIESLNVNSLLQHINEIRHVLLSLLTYIFAINESKIDELMPNNEIGIPGYNLIRKDRNIAGGGVVLYIRDNIPFSDRDDLVPSSLEMVCAEISRPHSKSFLVCTSVGIGLQTRT